ncbi:MAG: DUF2267 domain-containing protein [Myxococcaceae bacterium]|nr:DUF2267 domain-containing protein [Myxococcaceae bacterium]MCI0672742.1 DUF2267 domain-containing protein [Myxococcaceae bacterium]
MAEGPRQQAHRQTRSEVRTQQTFARFLDGLRIRTELPEDRREQVAVVVLGALQQRLLSGEADDLRAQLPRSLQELMAAHPAAARGSGSGVPASGVEFIQAVAQPLGVDFDEAERYIRAVFATVREHISEGEARDVESQLPPDLWSLWALTQ